MSPSDDATDGLLAELCCSYSTFLLSLPLEDQGSPTAGRPRLSFRPSTSMNVLMIKGFIKTITNQRSWPTLSWT